MTVRYSADFIKSLKKLDVRIRNNFIQKRILFQKNPQHPQLHNHRLKREWSGYHSINITADYRAIYQVIREGEELYAYFVTIGTHEQLCG